MDQEPKQIEKISKEVVESYIFTTARREFGMYGEKLLIRLVEIAQREVAGLNFKDGSALTKVIVGEWGDAEITVPIRDLLSSPDDKNYAKAKAAIKGLMGKFLEYEDEGTYRAASLLNDVDVDKVSGMAFIRVNRHTWNAMLDFSKGFRKYDVATAWRLKGRYSLRIYKMVSKQSTPITYSIAQLRHMWKLEDSYPKVTDLIRYTLAAAKEELDRVSPYSFDYTENKTRPEGTAGKKGRPAITSVTITPRYMAANDSLDGIRKLITPGLLIHPDTLDLLKNKFGFTQQGLRANISLLETAEQETDLFGLLQDIAPAALRADNPAGYAIGAIRTHLKEKCGILVDGDTVIRGAMAPQKKSRSLKDLLDD